MKRINSDAVADLEFQLRWESSNAFHTECYAAHNVNMWRDCFTPILFNKINGSCFGQEITIDFKPGEFTSNYDPGKTFSIKERQFNRRFTPHQIVEPRMGRFYPKGILKDVAGVFPQNLQPFRCVGVQNGELNVDFNHPLAKTAVQLKVKIGKIRENKSAQGGRCNDWSEIVAEGPGMQVRWAGEPTDFFSDRPFHRKDDTPDTIFYKAPRLVQHIDDTAIQVVKDLYGQLLKDGMRVLDLMSSWQSHIPTGVRLGKLTGLGLNSEELEKNNDLNDRVVHDLNANPVLPFESGEYDAVICTVSVEYLTQPEVVFNELARVLRPNGFLIVTFSNRRFSPKVIRIWEQLHEFERMGLVLEYFQNTENFKDLKTYSVRGLPRPWGDKYFPEKPYSDPIYAVWGRKEVNPYYI